MFDSAGVELRGTWIISYQTGENKPTPKLKFTSTINLFGVIKCQYAIYNQA